MGNFKSFASVLISGMHQRMRIKMELELLQAELKMLGVSNDDVELITNSISVKVVSIAAIILVSSADAFSFFATIAKKSVIDGEESDVIVKRINEIESITEDDIFQQDLIEYTKLRLG